MGSLDVASIVESLRLLIPQKEEPVKEEKEEEKEEREELKIDSKIPVIPEVAEEQAEQNGKFLIVSFANSFFILIFDLVVEST